MSQNMRLYALQALRHYVQGLHIGPGHTGTDRGSIYSQCQDQPVEWIHSGGKTQNITVQPRFQAILTLPVPEV